MLKTHQPYIKTSEYRFKYTFALASIGVLLLACGLVLGFSPTTQSSSVVYAAGDTRTLSDISTMQEMTQQICSNSEELETNTLEDTRDTNSYSIVKLQDGNCWMQQNLALGPNTLLTSADSDVSSNYTTPADTNSFNTSSDPTNGQMRVGSTSLNSSWKTEWGNYYSWNAATAGTGGSATAQGANATSSICPKGWKLPTGTVTGANTVNQFQNFFGADGANLGSSAANRFTAIQAAPYKFPAAGSYNGTSLNSPGTNGLYWSRTSLSSTYAYNLSFSSGYFFPGTNTSTRYFGCSVRCVAEGGLDKIEKPLFAEEANGNVNVVVPSTLTIDATSGMAENADSSKITEGTATATISSNTNYTITLHSTQPALKDPTVTTAEISPVSEINPVEPGNNSWGFWSNKTNADGSKVYDTPITTTPQEFYNTTVSSITDKGNTTTHTYYVGISIAPSLPSGTYSTDVTITAATK